MEDDREIKFRLTFDGEKEPYFSDVTSLFYDLELLYDFFLVLFVKDYENIKFTYYFLFRNRGIKNEHKLRVTRISKDSPLAIELAMNSVLMSTGVMTFYLEIIKWLNNREKSPLELEKLKLEIRILMQEAKLNDIEIENKLKQTQTIEMFNNLLKRLQKNRLKIKSVEMISPRNNERNN